MCHPFCHPSVKTLVFAGRARNPESPKLPECARMCPNVPRMCSRMCFFFQNIQGVAAPWWVLRGDTCGWSFSRSMTSTGRPGGVLARPGGPAGLCKAPRHHGGHSWLQQGAEGARHTEPVSPSTGSLAGGLICGPAVQTAGRPTGRWRWGNTSSKS